MCDPNDLTTVAVLQYPWVLFPVLILLFARQAGKLLAGYAPYSPPQFYPSDITAADLRFLIGFFVIQTAPYHHLVSFKSSLHFFPVLLSATTKLAGQNWEEIRYISPAHNFLRLSS